jgi:hypothetical protein
VAEKKKGIGDALIGLFVMRDEESAASPPSEAEDKPAADAAATPSPTGDPAVDDLIARYAGGKTPPRAAAAEKLAGQAAATGPVTEPATENDAAAPPPEAPRELPPDVPVDAPTLLKKAGLTDEELGRVDQALSLLHRLPSGTPLDVKRQIVAASLQAFGIPVDKILESALLHIGAFDRHVQAGEEKTQALLAESNRRLAEIEQEAARIRQIMQESRRQQQGLAFACSRQKMRVKEVLDFFGPEAVEHARKSSVKLRDRQE